jgi:hypothetical protein
MSAGFQEANRRHCEEPATKLRSNFALERRSNPWCGKRTDGLLRFARNDVEACVHIPAAASLARDRMQLRQLVERQLRVPIRQLEADDDVLTSKLAPKRIRGPFLRLRSARALDPNKVPVGHGKHPLADTVSRQRKLRA